ncbi:UPAR/Ly6 domain-containing protein twit [Haematobia irritans]|uniref:UPAR/Ly6 domain-containing protein twit n=1 Tax=Haematobia irritans TaxID=7368 RepID=UPI003F50CBD7
MPSSRGYIFAFVLIAILCLTSADGVLKCWRCSTDVSNGEFCNDPFDPSAITDQQRYWSYVNCTYTASVRSVNARPVCKKLVQEVYDKRVISRSCFYEDIDDPSDKCARDTTSSYIKTIYCETCSTDGCNGVSGLVPYGTLLALAAFLVKLIK